MNSPHPGARRGALDQLLDRFDLSPDYPPEVAQEVQQILRDPGIDDPRLLDLTALPLVTIDYPDSRDLDQALHLERGDGGQGFRLRYALADASYYARPGSALLAEALRRGVSYYLPHRVLPMLPPELSEDIVSLGPGVERRALVFDIVLDREGHATETRLLRARVRSRAKLSYSGVQRFLDAPDQSPLRGQPFGPSLELLRELGELRLALARERDVVHFNRQELVVELDPAGGGGLRLRRRPRQQVDRYNEQISLLCNIEGGRLLARLGRGQPHVQPVFRVHEAPPPEALEHLQRMLAGILGAHGLDLEQLEWRRAAPAESLADYLERLRGAGLGPRVLAAVERQALLTNQRSSYESRPGQHYALGVKPYSRFTAPMREVVGVFTHKEALEMLGLEPARGGAPDLALREQVIAAGNRARERQRSLDKAVTLLAIDQLLGRDLERPEGRRPVHRGTILGLQPSKLYVRLDDPPVELKVYTPDIQRALGCACEVSADGVTLRAEAGEGGAFRLGDAVDLRVMSYDRRRRRWRLAPVLEAEA